MMSFGKSKAKVFAEDETKVTFDDVAGIDEAKEELSEVVEFLKSSEKFQRLGGKIPKGVLLVGRFVGDAYRQESDAHGEEVQEAVGRLRQDAEAAGDGPRRYL